ncbi:Uncharacterised protein [uncultured archaeon]|nr:Uncharacterised protein [uncultured archaeon]
MERLKSVQDNLEIYNAGFPNFPRNFSRDSFISGILMKDTNLLRNQLLLSAKKQGKTKNSLTGEEKGKIFHESPGFPINGLSTEFNACDTTALFIIAHYHYKEITNDLELLNEQKENIINAIDYIKSHLIDYVFYENPTLSDSKEFALKVTYWKDSALAKRENGTPSYPVAYYLAHTINLCAIRCAAKLLDSNGLEEIANNMKEKIHQFIDLNKKLFYIAIDSKGPIDGICSDMLHSLFYLEPGDLTSEETDFIKIFSSELETKIGYLTLSPKLKKDVDDNYHSTTVWPFEQAIISIGAKKFGFDKIHNTSKKIINHLDTDPEIFMVNDNIIKKGGCDPQLWTIAAKKYFSSSVNS